MAEVEDFTTLTNVSPGLTNERLSKALTDWFKEEVGFTHWEFVGETGKGDSYLSEVIRIRIHGKTKEGSPRAVQVISKNIPKSKSRQLTFRSHEFFKNEIQFYEIVLPALLKFQAEKDISDPFTNYPKLFLTYCDGTNDVICLADVTLENYGSAFRQEGIDYDHCVVTLKALAKYHAMSFAMKDQKPEEFKKISSVVFEVYYAERLRSWYTRFWERIGGIAVDAVEREYPGSVYVDKIKKFCVPERYDEMIKATQTYETGVISHGDSWTNNFMYKYVDGAPEDVKMIDFQLTRCATPVLDVAFFVYACTTQDLRVKHYDDLLKYYYSVLSKQIRELGSDPDQVYSWDTFMEEIKKYSFFGLAFSFESTPMIILSPEDAVSMEMEGDEHLNIDDVWQIGPIKTKEGRLREANNVVHCVDYGYI